MPERKTVRRVPTVEVQGEGSWVEIRNITVGDILNAQQRIEERDHATGKSWFRLGQWFGGLFRRFARKRKVTQPGIYREFVYRVIGNIADWNWVDKEGDPLPNPREHPEVVEQLTDEEITFLIGIVYQGKETEDVKN